MTGLLVIAVVVSWAVVCVTALRVGPVVLDYWRTKRRVAA